jgi:hypothetical protein
MKPTTLKKQFFRWPTIARAVREYQGHLRSDSIFNGICLAALNWKYGGAFHEQGRGFYRLVIEMGTL